MTQDLQRLQVMLAGRVVIIVFLIDPAELAEQNTLKALITYVAGNRQCVLKVAACVVELSEEAPVPRFGTGASLRGWGASCTA